MVTIAGIAAGMRNTGDPGPLQKRAPRRPFFICRARGSRYCRQHSPSKEKHPQQTGRHDGALFYSRDMASHQETWFATRRFAS